jgi:hypothetical protein
VTCAILPSLEWGCVMLEQSEVGEIKTRFGASRENRIEITMVGKEGACPNIPACSVVQLFHHAPIQM